MMDEVFFHNPYIKPVTVTVDNLHRGDQMAVFITNKNGSFVEEIFNESIAGTRAVFECKQGTSLLVRVRNKNINRSTVDTLITPCTDITITLPK